MAPVTESAARSASAPDGAPPGMPATTAGARPGLRISVPLLPSTLLVRGAGLDEDPSPARRRRTGRDWWVDSWSFLLSLLSGAAVLGLIAIDPNRVYRVDGLDVAVGVSVCLAIWLRRRWLYATTLAVTILSVISPAAVGASALLLFLVSVHSRPRVAVLFGGLSVLSGLVYGLLHPSATTGPWIDLIINVIVAAAVVLAALFVRARRQLVLSLQERVVRMESEQRLLGEQARLSERARIAREMHDVLGHKLSLLTLQAGGLQIRPDLPPEAVRASAGAMGDTAREAMADLRQVIGVLRSDGEPESSSAPQPALADLDRLVEEFRAAGGRIDVLRQIEHAESAPGALARDVHRIVQEGLTNATNHAPGARVRVRLTGAPSVGMSVEVSNPASLRSGPPRLGGSGLVGLAERAELAGGRLHCGRGEDGRFTLSAWLPWPAR